MINPHFLTVFSITDENQNALKAFSFHPAASFILVNFKETFTAQRKHFKWGFRLGYLVWKVPMPFTYACSSSTVLTLNQCKKDNLLTNNFQLMTMHYKTIDQFRWGDNIGFKWVRFFQLFLSISLNKQQQKLAFSYWSIETLFPKWRMSSYLCHVKNIFFTF